MPLTTVIFDMDGLLIDSEPLWQEAGKEALSAYNIQLTDEQYHSSTGLRTPEWIDHWFGFFELDKSNTLDSINQIESSAIEKIRTGGSVMPGVEQIILFFKEKGFKIGLASSSPMRLIDVVVDKLQIGDMLNVKTSAEGLPFGKPHPQVFIDCAKALQSPPGECLVFEDSFNGMIAAKAAKMKCVVVPPAAVYDGPQWGAADLKIRSLEEFGEKELGRL